MYLGEALCCLDPDAVVEVGIENCVSQNVPCCYGGEPFQSFDCLRACAGKSTEGWMACQMQAKIHLWAIVQNNLKKKTTFSSKCPPLATHSNTTYSNKCPPLVYRNSF